MIRGPLLLLTIWLDAAKMLRSTSLTLGWKSSPRLALGVGVEVLTYPTMLVQLPNGDNGLLANLGVLHYHGLLADADVVCLIFDNVRKWLHT
jgi:hypothetical protein